MKPKRKYVENYEEEVDYATPFEEPIEYKKEMMKIATTEIEQPIITTEKDPSAYVEEPKYFIGAILMCDAGLTYAVIDTFTNSCVVEPIDNDGCFACEVMSFKAMEQEGWKIIGRQI